MDLHVHVFTFNPFQENTILVYNSRQECLIIDPGCFEMAEKNELLDFVNQHQLKVLALLNTHCHIDHVLGNAFVKKQFNVDFYMHELDLPTLHSVSNYAHVYGFEGYELSPEPTHLITDGQELKFGSIELEVIFGPGHAPGHVAFYNAENNILIGGDILFKGSFGRVDLPGGSMEVLKKTIFERIFTLPENTVIYPGHGSSTTIGEEKVNNYILQF